MKKTAWLGSASFLLLCLLVIFSYAVKHGRFNQFDFDTTVRIQNHLPTSWDTPLSVLSLLGSFEVVTLALLFIVIIRRKFWRGLATFFIYFSGLMFEVFGKTLVYHPGPPFFFFRYNLRFFFPSSYVSTEYSYPSGHAMRTTFLIVILLTLVVRSPKISFGTKYLLEAGLVIFLLAMIVSRVSLGEHWASDAIAGFLLGAGLGLLALVPTISDL